MSVESFDATRAWLRGPDLFERFRIPEQGERLKDTDLPASAELLIVERFGQRRALPVREMAYHHVAQGKLAGEPYLVSF